MNNTITTYSALRAAIQAVCIPYPTITPKRIDAACEELVGKSEADEVIPRQDAAKKFHVHPATLDYHARRGRIRRVTIPGSKRSLGFYAADIAKILKGE